METYLDHLITTNFTALGWEARVVAPGDTEPHPVILRATESEGVSAAIKRAMLLIAAMQLRKKHQRHQLGTAA
jgi:hypothetical protein